jgi:NAD(P)-dependent dehydrogenase (short-subunit alcohol dehydrogenase family)
MSTESVSAPVGLVTGADKGIGLEKAGRLAGAGYRARQTHRRSGRTFHPQLGPLYMQEINAGITSTGGGDHCDNWNTGS